MADPLRYEGDGRGPDLDAACPECGCDGPHPYWPDSNTAECADCCEEFEPDPVSVPGQSDTGAGRQ